MWQTINFYEIFESLLPTFLRKKIFLHIMSACAKPLVEIYEETLYKMQHDSRVINLEKMLNEHFSVLDYSPQSHNATKKVFISNAPEQPKKYIFQPQENEPMYLDTVYLGEENPINYKFIVNVPAAYVFSEPNLRAKIDYYKLAGKKYIIQTY